MTDTLLIPTEAWAAFQWVTLAASRDDVTPALTMVKLDYTPATESTPPRLMMVATDRFRVHRVRVDLPRDDNVDATEGWSQLVPAKIIAEAAKHPTVGKTKQSGTLLTVTDSRIEAGDEGWGAALPDKVYTFPSVEKLMHEPDPDATSGPIAFNAKFLADLSKYTLGGRHDNVWQFTWTQTGNGKPAPVLARRVDNGIVAEALIQPNLLSEIK